MKKTMIGLAVAASFGSLAVAEDASSNCACKYVGWYAGAGLSWQYTKGDGIIDVTPANNAFHNKSLIKPNGGKIGGSLIGGYGNYITGKCYLGAELTLDITGNKTKKSQYTLATAEMKTRGVVPTLAVRLGGYVPQIDSLIYLRAGFTFLNNEFKTNVVKEKIKSQSVTPILGLGIEKNAYNKLNVRLEGDYRFGADKSKNNLQGYGANGAPINGLKVLAKNKTRGCAVRLLCTYNF